MANKVYEYYKGLPTWGKGVVVIGGLAVTYLFASQIISKIKEDAARRKAEKNLKNANSDLNNALNNGQSLTYGQSQYDAWVSQIVNQFKGCDASCTFMPEHSLICATDSFKLIANIIKSMKNDADWLNLVTTFKIQSYDDCLSWINDKVSGDLYTCVTNELSNDERKALNKVLKKSNITYQFA